MTATAAWLLIGTAAWTTAIVLALHWWTQIRRHEDDDDPEPFHFCQWVSCQQNATNQVRVHHPAGDVQLWVCDTHLRWACRAQDQSADVYDQAIDELEDHANNGGKP